MPCQTPVRVKIAEPGMYWRMCPKCEQVIHYALVPLTDQPGVLTFRWVTGEEYGQWRRDQLRDCAQEEI